MAKYERQKIEPDDWLVEVSHATLKDYVAFPLVAEPGAGDVVKFASLGTAAVGPGQLEFVFAVVPHIFVKPGMRILIGSNRIPPQLATKTLWLSLHARHPLSGQDDGEVNYG